MLTSHERLVEEQMGIGRVMEQIHRESAGINLARNVVIAGSASMVAHGLDRDKQIGDIDLFVTTELWFSMHWSGEWQTYITRDQDNKRKHDPPFLYKHFPWDIESQDTIEVNVFFEWRARGWGNIDIKQLFEEAIVLPEYGMQFCSMPWLLDWKRGVKRDKDIPDIDLIEEFVRGNNV